MVFYKWSYFIVKELLITFWENNSELILNIAYNSFLAVLILLASYFIAKFAGKAIDRANNRIKSLDATLIPVLCTTANYLIYGIGIVIILDIFGVNTTSIIALLGAAGLAIGFALKDTLANIAAGVMLLFLRPFSIDDYIECGSISGKIKQVGLFTTILETSDGLFISSPNGELWSAPIKNFTRNGKRRMEFVVGISYSDSIDKGFEVLNSLIKQEPRILTDPSPQIMVRALAESSVNLQLRAWAKVDDYWDIYWEFGKKIKEQIEGAGLTIPFSQKDVHIYNENSKN